MSGGEYYKIVAAACAMLYLCCQQFKSCDLFEVIRSRHTI